MCWSSCKIERPFLGGGQTTTSVALNSSRNKHLEHSVILRFPCGSPKRFMQSELCCQVVRMLDAQSKVRKATFVRRHLKRRLATIASQYKLFEFVPQMFLVRKCETHALQHAFPVVYGTTDAQLGMVISVRATVLTTHASHEFFLPHMRLTNFFVNEEPSVFHAMCRSKQSPSMIEHVSRVESRRVLDASLRCVQFQSFFCHLVFSGCCSPPEVLEEHINARDDGTAGTASYQHCLHRVNTMSDDALLRRVRRSHRCFQQRRSVLC